MNLQDPQVMLEHVQLQRVEMQRAVAYSRLAHRLPSQPTLVLRWLGSVGVVLVRIGAGLQRLAGQQPAQPVRI